METISSIYQSVDESSCSSVNDSKTLTNAQIENHKLQADGFVIQFEEFKTFERNFENLRLVSLYGTAEICRYGITSRYQYYATCVSGKLHNVAIRSMENEELFPKLKYNTSAKSFSFNNKIEFAVKTGNTKEVILSALLIWGKLQLCHN